MLIYIRYIKNLENLVDICGKIVDIMNCFKNLVTDMERECEKLNLCILS